MPAYSPSTRPKRAVSSHAGETSINQQPVSGRTPPQNLDAEVSTLGALLLDPEAMLKVADYLTAEDFYRPDYGLIYEAMVVLTEKRAPIDILTVADELTRIKKLDEVGGPAALSTLVSSVATASNVQHYAHIVREKAMLRRLIQAAGRIGELGYQEELESEIVLDQAEQTLFGVTQRFLRQNFIPVRSILTESFERLDALSKQEGSLRGVSTGYQQMDAILGGLQKSDLVILAARPSMGKCMTGDTEILDPHTGQLHTIQELVEAGRGQVATLQENFKFTSAIPQHYVADGIKPTYRVLTALGREIETTFVHPFLTRSGWKRLEELKEGDEITVPNRLPYFGKDLWDKEKPDLTEWVNNQEELPPAVFSFTKKDLSAYLSHLLGSSIFTPRDSTSPVIEFIHSSKKLIRQIQHLLLRFGILSSISQNQEEYKLQIIGNLAQDLDNEQLGGDKDIYFDQIVSITPTGAKPVYDLTIPETHNFVANDFVVHNTALALNIAEHVAVHQKKTVGIFSLEMSKEQLVDRLISSLGLIDSWKLRNGKLNDDDFHNLNEAYGLLAEANLFIDDTAAANIMEVRAKSRRLQAEYGLDLIIVDYLQLMEGRSHGNSDNRVQEVSEISRSLKALAKEINCPVLALSQLSRAVESRPDKRPMLSDLRESGCVSGDTLIQNADTGKQMRIRELVGQTQIPVWSMDEHNRLVRKTISKVFSSGYKQTYELKLRSGRTIKASANHKFRLYTEWARLDQLEIGQRLATPRMYPDTIPHNLNYSSELLMFFAHMVGDGCYVPHQPLHYTSADPANIAAVKYAAEKLYGIKAREVIQNNWSHLYLPSPHRTGRNNRHPFYKWLFEQGLELAHSYEKRLPASLFSCSNPQIQFFLKHLWATDGCMHHQDGRVTVYYSTTSKKLAAQVQSLLLRLGIVTQIHTIRQEKQGKVFRPSFHVEVQGKPNQERFLSLVGCYGHRGISQTHCQDALTKVRANTNIDTVDKSIWHDLIVPEKIRSGKSWREVQSDIGMQYCGSALFKHGLSRERLGRVALALQSPVLKDLAVSDIYWDEIISITPLLVEEVFDATVPGTHNFVANDYVVHNSIEQDADVVIFLYREDYYNKEEQSNLMEVLVRKHRNGPTGDAKLLARLQFSRFENLDTHHFAN